MNYSSLLDIEVIMCTLQPIKIDLGVIKYGDSLSIISSNKTHSEADFKLDSIPCSDLFVY